MPTTVYDTGYFNGSLISLAGVIGKKFRGLRVYSESDQIAVGGAQLVFPSNPSRYWALITNDSLRNLLVAFTGAPGDFHNIKPGGNLLINQNLPWTGAIVVYPDVAMGVDEYVVFTEASVQP